MVARLGFAAFPKMTLVKRTRAAGHTLGTERLDR
jgi:hypothetical protein